MIDDSAEHLLRLRGEAARSLETFEAARRGLPPRAEGADRTYTVVVILDADGLPGSIDVDEDWQRKLRAESLCGAVMEAFSAASHERLRAWTMALADAGEVDAPDSAERNRSVPPPPEVPSRRPDLRRPRNAAAFAREVLEVVDGLGDVLHAPEPRGVGSVAYGKLTISISPGVLVSCTADPTWVSQRSGQELTEALGAALAAARDDLAATATPTGRLQRLLEDGLAIMDETGSSTYA